MKTKHIKQAVNKAMKIYCSSGFTNTAERVRNEIFNELDRVNKRKSRR